MGLLKVSRRRTLTAVAVLLCVFVPLWFIVNYRIIDLLQKNEAVQIFERMRNLAGSAKRQAAIDDKRPVREMAIPYDIFRVPNIVHYIWFGEKDFKFHNLLSMLSAKRFLKPEKVFLHTDKISHLENFHSGASSQTYWNQAKEIVDVKIVKTEPPREFNGKAITNPHHQSLLARIQILAKFGGIYLDDDVIVLRPFDDIRRYDFVIAREKIDLNPGIMLSHGNSTFLTKWLNCFKEYNETLGVDGIPMSLIRDNSMFVFIEKERFQRLDDFRSEDRSNNIFHGHINHDEHFALKLYYEYFDKRYTEYEIKYMNTTFGEIARKAYYGDSRLLTLTPDWPSKPKNDAPLVVPNIVHYVWFYNDNFTFRHFLSVKSAVKIQKAETVYFHCDSEPTGKWWDQTQKMAGSALKVMHRKQPIEVFGKPITNVIHRSDVIRIEVLLEYGGVYLDPDAIIVNNLDPLRRHECTLGLDILGLNNGVMLAVPKSKFMQLYLDSYAMYDETDMYLNSKMIPYDIASKNIDSIHIETIRLARPEWSDWWDLGRLWKDGYKPDWSHLYVIQLAYSYHGTEYDDEDIKMMDNTFGEIARYIYYGSSECIPNCNTILTT